MFISYKHKFLFVHIAKTGGTSIRAALMTVRLTDPFYVPLSVCSRLSSLFSHRLGSKFPRHSKVIAAYEMLPREFFNELFKFAFVRNPWDLQVSSFHHIRRERPHLMDGIEDFETFLRWKLDPDRPYQYHIDTSIELQSDYLVDLHGKVLVDFIGRYERLEEDFREVCEKVGLKNIHLPHKRKAKDRTNYTDYYNSYTKQLVADHFRKDIEMLGYEF